MCDEQKVYLRLIPDFDPVSPRDWDNLGTMVFWHNRYNLGDKHNFSIEEFEEMLKDKNVITLAVYMYEHGGISLSVSRSYPFNCPWDSGQLGWIYVTKEKIRKEYGTKRITKKILERVIKNLEIEVEVYSQYLSGDVWGFELYTKCPCCDDGEEIIDSCWGFYGTDLKENGMLDYIPEQYRDLPVEYKFS